MSELKQGFLKIVDYWKILLLAFIVTFILQKFIFILAVIPSESMETTLNIGDRIFSYSSWLKPEITYDDIVVFKPNTGEEEYWIKRVIGLPGDKIRIEHGTVYVNGNEQAETYVSSTDDYSGSFTVPNDSYFVLGDNRSNSKDARYWSDPYIKKTQIKYIALFRVFPFNSIGFIK